MAKIYTLTLAFLLLGLAPSSASAATLSFSEPATSYSVGQTFSVGVYAGSSDQAMNAASGVISFPWDKLEVVSLSKTGSILSLWIQEPSFSNSAGTVSFEGVVPNPGYTGASGKILTITFKAKSVGTANLSFSSGSVLANDGTGTNILNGSRVAVVNIGAKSSLSPISGAEEVISEDNAPTITSETHPDQAKWYANNSPEFSWVLPDGAIEVRTLVGTSPKSVPTIRYAPAISSKKIDALPDGIYYFHLQIRTASGWGGVAHYRVNIDTTPPKSFSITFPHGTKGLEPQPIILFNTVDSESGVSHYDIKIGSGGPLRISPSAISNPYPLPSQLPGAHIVTVTAFDRAGNTTNASADFIIEGIDAPIITYYQDKVESSDSIKIRGTTYPDSDITILFKQDEKVISEEHTLSNSSGDFAFFLGKHLDGGTYTFTARVTDGRGAKSDETKPFTILVSSKFLTDLTTFILNYFSVAILALLALGGIIGTGIFMWYRFARVIRGLRRESREAEKVLGKSFAILRKDIASHVARLKSVKRKLTTEEVDFLEQFEEELGEAEDAIAKEIQDISHS